MAEIRNNKTKRIFPATQVSLALVVTGVAGFQDGHQMAIRPGSTGTLLFLTGKDRVRSPD